MGEMPAGGTSSALSAPLRPIFLKSKSRLIFLITMTLYFSLLILINQGEIFILYWVSLTVSCSSAIVMRKGSGNYGKRDYGRTIWG